jgi:hypothetical protein
MDIAGIDVNKVGEHSDALVEIDQHGDHGIAEGWVLRIE